MNHCFRHIVRGFINRPTNHIYFRFSKQEISRLEKLYEQKKYYEIFGINRPEEVTEQELKSKYHSLLSKYHPDKTMDEPNKQKNEEITKSIVAAYKSLEKRGGFRNKDTQGNTTYSRTYQSDREEREIPRRHPPQSSPMNVSSLFGIAFFGGIACLILSKMADRKKQDQEIELPPKRIYTDADCKEIVDNATKNYAKRVQKLIDSVRKERPPSLVYPREDADLITQLTQFSIGPDIHLYEVPSAFFSNEELQAKLKQNQNIKKIRKYELTHIKPNTAMTLSLEAERCLHNIYVRTKDVAAQLEKKGYYTPPKVFFRYYGYIMFEIRQKPMSLLQYRNTKYVSLFDLYFDYYSPIFLKRDNYNAYMTNRRDEKQFGLVHINHRRIEETLVKGSQKVVFVNKLENPNSLNNQTWSNFYRKFDYMWKMKPKAVDVAGKELTDEEANALWEDQVADSKKDNTTTSK